MRTRQGKKLRQGNIHIVAGWMSCLRAIPSSRFLFWHQSPQSRMNPTPARFRNNTGDLQYMYSV